MFLFCTMVRPSRNNTNLLCIDAGFERKNKFNEAIGKSKSMTKALIQYMDSVIEEHEKEKRLREITTCLSPVKPTLTLSAENIKQSTLDKFFPFWLLNHKDYKFQQEVYNSLSEDQKTEVMIALNRTTERFKSYRLGKKMRS